MKIKFSIKSFDNSHLRESIFSLNSICKKYSNKLEDIFYLPIKIKKFCLLRSPHVNKDSREAFEIRQHKCIATINLSNISNNKNFVNALLKASMPAGVACAVKLENK